MLKKQRQASSAGFSLIELMVAVAIAGVLLAVGVPAFSGWIQNTRIRNTAQDIYTGLQQAKTNAVQRNARMRFQLTSDVSSSCALTTTGTAWVINQVDAATPDVDASGQCNVAIDDPATTPRIMAVRPPENNSRVQVTASASSIVFTGLGKLPAPLPAADFTIDVTASNGTCAAAGGTLTCLRIIVSPTGQPRMCNPNPQLPAGDPQAC